MGSWRPQEEVYKVRVVHIANEWDNMGFRGLDEIEPVTMKGTTMEQGPHPLGLYISKDVSSAQVAQLYNSAPDLELPNPLHTSVCITQIDSILALSNPRQI